MLFPTLSRANSNYFPDDLPSPAQIARKAPSVEVTYSQCGCTITDHSPAFAHYGDVVDWEPSSPVSDRVEDGSSETGTPPRARSPSPGDSEKMKVVKRTEEGFCERAECARSSVFNREWARIWTSRESEREQALNDDNIAFENFKRNVREEARIATENELGPLVRHA